MLVKLFLIIISIAILSCKAPGTFRLTIPAASELITGKEFYNRAAASKWQQRDSLALKHILAGNIPSFLKHFVRIDVSIIDSSTNTPIKAHYFVAPDYLAIGTDADWARVPLTPMTAQVIADSFNCFLPTRKIVNDIYQSAKVKMEPVPMYAYRDSSPTMWHHHLIIEGERQGRTGLIAGIKKDVVISGKIPKDSKSNRVAIYGWHKLDGKPIQPLYTGHVNWWVDYSHGIRLIYRTIWVNGKSMDYTDVLKHSLYKRLLCDEEHCDFYRY